MGGTKVGLPLEKSVMMFDDHAGPVISGGDAVTSHELGLMEVKVLSGAGGALLLSPNTPAR